MSVTASGVDEWNQPAVIATFIVGTVGATAGLAQWYWSKKLAEDLAVQVSNIEN